MTAQSQPLTKTSKKRRWSVRILIAMLILIALVFGGTLMAGASAKTTMAAQNPAPGQLVDVGGYKLHINCQGSGSPTVILDAGLNDFSLSWSKVQPDVAPFTRVCAYDRAGLGWSEASPLPRTSQTMVKELYTLLQNAGIEGPYVLAGHSFGGVNMRLFAHHYPEDVAGLLQVDAAHEDMFNRKPELFRSATEQAVTQFNSLAWMSGAGLLALSPEQIPVPDLSAEAMVQYRSVLATTAFFETAVAESTAFEESLAQLNAVKPAQLSIPLIVLTRGQPEPLPGLSPAAAERFEQLWPQLQTELLTLSANSHQIVAQESGHYIQLSQPQLVVDAIRELVTP